MIFHYLKNISFFTLVNLCRQDLACLVQCNHPFKNGKNECFQTSMAVNLWTMPTQHSKQGYFSNSDSTANVFKTSYNICRQIDIYIKRSVIAVSMLCINSSFSRSCSHLKENFRDIQHTALKNKGKKVKTTPQQTAQFCYS